MASLTLTVCVIFVDIVLCRYTTATCDNRPAPATDWSVILPSCLLSNHPSDPWHRLVNNFFQWQPSSEANRTVVRNHCGSAPTAYLCSDLCPPPSLPPSLLLSSLFFTINCCCSPPSFRFDMTSLTCIGLVVQTDLLALTRCRPTLPFGWVDRL
jgi:hypothetical protein